MLALGLGTWGRLPLRGEKRGDRRRLAFPRLHMSMLAVRDAEKQMRGAQEDTLRDAPRDTA